MKTIKFFLIIFIILFKGCSNPLEYEKEYFAKYFPLTVGNVWYYKNPNSDTKNGHIKIISDSSVHDNKRYYKWTSGEGTDNSDNIRADRNGNILLLKDNTEILWFDFSQDSGSTYIFRNTAQFGGNTYYYNVHVRTNLKIEVPAGVFDSCIVFLFDIPQVKDEEIFYAFAPNVGLIDIGYDGWYSLQLTKAMIDGKQFGIWE